MCALYGHKVLISSNKIINSLFASRILTLITCNFCSNYSASSRSYIVAYTSQFTLTHIDLKSFLSFSLRTRFLPLLGRSHIKLIQSRFLSQSNFFSSSNSSSKIFLFRLLLLARITELAKTLSLKFLLLSLNNYIYRHLN